MHVHIVHFSGRKKSADGALGSASSTSPYNVFLWQKMRRLHPRALLQKKGCVSVLLLCQHLENNITTNCHRTGCLKRSGSMIGWLVESSEIFNLEQLHKKGRVHRKMALAAALFL